MKKTFERELPEGYEPALVIDAQKKSVAVILTVINLILVAGIVLLSFFIIRPEDFSGNYSIIRNLVFAAAMFLYIVLHELVHGLAYKLLTGEKLTFGLTIAVAYCGVPKIYVYRKAAMIALLAPFVLFSAVFLALACLLPNAWDRFYSAILFAFHFGGCVGDLWGTFIYLFKFRSADTLMQDTGPRQTFYVKK